jgi:hypothetical protein
MTFTGTISREEGRYFATVPDTGLKYEITGQDFSNVTGKNATITGAADVAATPHSGAAAVVTVSNVSPVGSGAVAGGAGMGLGAKAFIVGVVVGGGTGLGYGIHHLIENNGSSQ